MSQDNHPHPLDDFEAQLAALRPAPASIDRDALLYAAGRAAGEAGAACRRATLARTASALLTAASVALAATFAGLWWHAASRPAPQVVHVPSDTVPAPPAKGHAEMPAPPALAPPAESYIRLRQVALRDGIDAWPERRPTGSMFTLPARALTLALPPEEG